jgi:hypothetical protein
MAFGFEGKSKCRKSVQVSFGDNNFILSFMTVNSFKNYPASMYHVDVDPFWMLTPCSSDRL